MREKKRVPELTTLLIFSGTEYKTYAILPTTHGHRYCNIKKKNDMVWLGITTHSEYVFKCWHFRRNSER